MKFSRGVGIGESSSHAIGQLQSGGGGKLPKKRSATPSRFTMSMGEVKGGVLRERKCCFHGCFPKPGESGRVADQPSKRNLQHIQTFPNLIWNAEVLKR